jgi:hypothetical protein
VGRGIAALASDPDRTRWNQKPVTARLSGGKHAARKLRRAQLLLAADGDAVHHQMISLVSQRD